MAYAREKDTGPYLQDSKAATHFNLLERHSRLALHRFNLTKPINIILIIIVKATSLPIIIIKNVDSGSNT